MLETRHPEWVERVEYWHVHDLDQASAAQALAEIEVLIDGLVTRLLAWRGRTFCIINITPVNPAF